MHLRSLLGAVAVVTVAGAAWLVHSARQAPHTTHLPGEAPLTDLAPRAAPPTLPPVPAAAPPPAAPDVTGGAGGALPTAEPIARIAPSLMAHPENAPQWTRPLASPPAPAPPDPGTPPPMAIDPLKVRPAE